MKHRLLSRRGVALLAVLILLAVIGIATSATVSLGVVVQRRLAEQALLDIGHEFKAALQSYASATPAGQSPYPTSVEDLLKDTRVPGVRRHLRQLYADPLTGRVEWGLLSVQATAPTAAPTTAQATVQTNAQTAAPTGSGIAAIVSLAGGQPIKQDNFDAEFVGFEHRSSYADWQFKADHAMMP